MFPLHKAKESRRARRATTQGLTALLWMNEEAADLIESSAGHDVQRVRG